MLRPNLLLQTSFIRKTFRQNAHFGAKYKTKDNRYLSKEANEKRWKRPGISDSSL